MKPFQYLIILLACGITGHIPGQDAQGYRPADAPGKLIVNGTSNLHDWSLETSKIEGSVESNGDKITALTVEIPVKSLESDKDKLNKNVYKALKEPDYKLVRFVLSGPAQAAAEDAAAGWVLPGKLTIRDQTLDVELLSDVTLDEAGGMVITGSLTLNMEDWGIDPPTALMGMARTGPEVTVSFEWKLNPVSQP
jgi:polyisoprenoid-binding protein YceI